MSVNVTQPINGPYIPNGATTAFAFDFKIGSTAEIAVYQLDPTGKPVAVSAAAYAVTIGVGGEGGTVTFTTAPATGSGSIYLGSNPTFTQTANFTSAGPFNPATLNDPTDRAAIRDIYIKGKVDRAATVPFGEAGIQLPSAAARANDYLAFDASGNPIPGSESGAATSSAQAASSAAAASTSATNAAASATSAATSASAAATSANLSTSSYNAIAAAIAPGSLNNATLNAATRAILAGLSHATGLPAVLTESGREGTFVFSTANLSSQVTNDPNQGVYVAPSSDTTGATGAWVRIIPDVVKATWFGVVTGATDQAANFQAWANFISEYGYHGWVPKGSYTCGLVEFWHKTRVTFAPGCVFTLATGGSSIFRIGRWQPNTASVNYNVQPTDFRIDGNGCRLNGIAAAASHVVQITGAQRVDFANFVINGANGTGGKDCVYVGGGQSFPGLVTSPAKDVHLRRITAFGAGRNIISVASCDGFIIEECDLSATTGVLVGACIDVEANTFADVIRRGVIRSNRVHDNPKYGVLVNFGDDVEVYENTFASQGLEAMVVAAGGAQFQPTVARSGIEYRAITGPLDTAAGWIPLSNVDTLEIGTLVICSTRGAGVLPPELTADSYYFVVDKDAANTKIRLARSALMYTFVGTFTNAGSGTLTADPMTSELYLRCLTEGQASNVKIHHNRFLGTSGGLAEVLCSLALKVDISDNMFTCTTADRTAIHIRYSRKIRAYDNKAVGYAAGTTAVGMSVSSSYDVTYGGNEFKNFNGYGAYFVNVREVKERGRDIISNCGKTSFPVRLEGCLRPQVRFKVANDVGYVTTNGIALDLNTLYGIIDRCDVTNAGNSAGNAISFVSTTTVMGRNVMRDGSIQSGLTGTTTGPASLATGTSTVTLTLTGAVANDRAWATLSAATAGVSITSVYAGAGNVNIVYSNTNGAASNLSGVTVLYGAERVRVS